MTVSIMATDFTQLSTEELVSLRGTVAADEVTAYQEELQDRLSSLTQEERQALMSKKNDATATRTQSRAMDALNGDIGTGNMGSGTGAGTGAGGGHGGGNGGGHGGPR